MDWVRKLLALGFEDKKLLKRDLEVVVPSLTSTASAARAEKRQRYMNSDAVISAPVTRKKATDNKKEVLKRQN